MSSKTFDEFKEKISQIETKSARLVLMMLSEYKPDVEISHVIVQQIFIENIKLFPKDHVKSLIICLVTGLIVWLQNASMRKIISFENLFFDILETDRLFTYTLKDALAVATVFGFDVDTFLPNVNTTDINPVLLKTLKNWQGLDDNIFSSKCTLKLEDLILNMHLMTGKEFSASEETQE